MLQARHIGPIGCAVDMKWVVGMIKSHGKDYIAKKLRLCHRRKHQLMAL